MEHRKWFCNRCDLFVAYEQACQLCGYAPRRLKASTTGKLNEPRTSREQLVSDSAFAVRKSLTDIIGFSRLLEAELKGHLTTRQQEYLGKIMRHAGDILNAVTVLADNQPPARPGGA